MKGASFDREPFFRYGPSPLTKRERIAMENMAALLSEGGNVEPELEAYAKIAVRAADTLLKELNGETP